MLTIRGVVKDYDWGRIDGLEPWCGVTSGGPQAELWFGAHPAGPSPVATGGLLHDHLADGHAPLLVKVLAAAAPLSLQVHPDAATAAAGHAARPDVYADAHEKTEMLVALERFEALVGWRAPDRAAAVLAGAGLPGDLVDLVGAGEHAASVRALLQLPGETCAPWVARVTGAAFDAGLSPAAAAALARIARTHPDDPGVFVAALLEHVELAPGDAAYVPAGVPHSYVEGLGVEVMTASDNVLRLGLTGKRVSIDDAVAAFRDDRVATVLRARHADEPLAPAGAPFAVALHRRGEWPMPGGSYRVALALAGEVSVRTDAAAVRLEPGTAAVVPAADPAALVSVDGLVALVTSTDVGGDG